MYVNAVRIARDIEKETGKVGICALLIYPSAEASALYAKYRLFPINCVNS